jgi:hypothetical protein
MKWPGTTVLAVVTFEEVLTSLSYLRLRGTGPKLICKLVHRKGSQLWFSVGVLPTFTRETHKTSLVAVPVWLRFAQACLLCCVQILQSCLRIGYLKGNAYGFYSENSAASTAVTENFVNWLTFRLIADRYLNTEHLPLHTLPFNNTHTSHGRVTDSQS